MKTEITFKEIENFINLSHFDIYLNENKLLSIGLKKGYSKNLKPFFSRKKQIQLLNHIQENFNLYKDLIY